MSENKRKKPIEGTNAVAFFGDISLPMDSLETVLDNIKQVSKNKSHKAYISDDRKALVFQFGENQISATVTGSPEEWDYMVGLMYDRCMGSITDEQLLQKARFQ